MVASHDYAPVAASSLVVQSENEVPAFPILDRGGTCGYGERGAQVHLLKVEGRQAAGDFGPPLSGFGLVAPIGSTVHDFLLRPGEEAWWKCLLAPRAPPVGKIVDWH